MHMESPAALAEPWWQSPLTIGRYRLRAEVLEPLTLPPFAGSLLRGQWGAALRSLTCTTGASRCTGCPHAGACVYSTVFDGSLPAEAPHQHKGFSQVPNAYVIRPPQGGRTLQPGEQLEFDLVLLGHAVDQLPTLAAAWHMALAQGLGPHRAKARLVHIAALGEADTPHTLWTPAAGSHLPPHQARLQVPIAAWQGDACTIQLPTPLRLQHQNSLVGVSGLTAPVFLGALGRRIGLLLEMHTPATGVLAAATALPALAAQVRLEASVRWHDWQRYSARQQQAMTLGGLVGHVTLHTSSAAVAQALWPWLWLGQWLHAGKNATMGLGQLALGYAGGQEQEHEGPA